MPRTIERQAIGRFARLGQLYDIRKDCFTSNSIFLEPLSKSDIRRDDFYSNNVKFIYSENLLEKYKKLDIEAELQMSLLAGMVKVGGSGTFLSETSTSQRVKRMFFIFNVNTAREDIDIRSLKNKIDVESLKDTDATHVVVEIEWGARCTITCDTNISKFSDDSVAHGALKAEISKLSAMIGEGQADIAKTKNKNDEKFTFSSKCDVSDLSQDLPVTQEEAIQTAKKLTSVVKNINEGKGIPMVFHLLPLTEVVRMCKLQLKINAVLQDIQDHIVEQSVQFCEEFQNRQRMINDVHDDFKRSKDYISDVELTAIESLNNGFKVFKSRFHEEMGVILVKIRSKEKDVSELQALITQYQNDVNFSESEVSMTLRQLGWVYNKIATVEKFKARGIKYIGRKGILDVNGEAQHVYVLYFDQKIRTLCKDAWEQNFNFYLSLNKNHGQDDNFAFVVVDLELRPEEHKHTMVPLPNIVHYQDGQPTCKDVLAMEGKDRDQCLIDLSNGKLNTKPMPNNRAPVKILCPNSMKGKCQTTPQNWKCKRCKSSVAYGIDDKMLYCTGDCRTVAHQSQITFRCKNLIHGVAFVPFPDKDVLKHELCKLRPLKQTNILILGETGVGKSTWINAIANYICFDSLEEAEKNDFYALIASKFSIFNDKGESVEISVGQNEDNENINPGESATQYPKAHFVYLKDEVLCLIDTPGIGDSRGLVQDNTNFQNILTHLSNYEEIHGICILLKPNNARLTIMFRFCINELLTHLHKSAVANIVFCFTNSRGTMYRPGDTFPALKKLLGENKLVKIDLTPTTYYCFDNEAFRFLACLKNGQQYDDSVKKLYSESWTKSVDETFRLFNHIEQLTPHPVKETSTLNDARRIINEMNQPIAEVVKIIEKNMVLSKQFKDKIARHDKEVELLEKDLTFNGVDLDIKQLSQPITTCTHGSCTKFVTVGNPKNNIQKKIYPRNCHKPCTLSHVPNQIIGHTSLRKCRAFRIFGFPCSVCGHSWKLHMHIKFEVTEVSKTFTNEVVNKERYERLSNKEKIELKLKQQQILMDELEKEKERILKISNEFGHFLKTHSIVPYNDVVEEYLEMSIKAEEEKEKSIQNKDLIEKLKEDKKRYKETNAIIEKAMKTNDPKIKVPTIEEIKQKRDELCLLKNFGETFKRALQNISQINSTNFAYQMGTPLQASSSKQDQRKPTSNEKWKFLKNKCLWSTGGQRGNDENIE